MESLRCNVINGEANLQQTLIKDKHCPMLSILPASQTRDKDALTEEGVEKVIIGVGSIGIAVAAAAVLLS